MNRLLLALCTLLSALSAHAQFELSSGTFNNVFVAPATVPVAPGPTQTAEQFAAMGQVAGAVGPLSLSVTFADRYPANADKSLVLATARVGTFYSQGLPLYFMGDQILPPLKQGNNITNAGPNYWRAKPVLPGEVITPLAEYVTVNTSSTSSPTVNVASVPPSLVVGSKMLGRNVNAIASPIITLSGNANATITTATPTAYRPLTAASTPGPVMVNVMQSSTSDTVVTIAAAPLPPLEMVVGATLLGQPITAINGTAVTLAGKANANINASTPTTVTPATSYYYSVHAEKVFASQPGRVAITWVSNLDANGAYEIKTEDFAVSSTTGAELPVRTIYWTEGSFDGPLVQITDGRITTANPVYNPIVPMAVAQEVVVPGYTPSRADFSTLTFERFNGVGQLKAYNVEGRILVEYLGNVRLAGVIHEHVGLDVVDIKRTPTQVKKTVHLGQEITPHDGDLTLTPSPVLKGVQNAASFYGTTVRPNGKNAYFAEKATGEPFTPDFGETEPDSYNQVVFYWLQSGSFGIQWPKYQNRYWQRWSPNLADYAHYTVDPDLTASTTGIAFTGGGLPQLVYQDDQAGVEAAIDVTTQRFFVKLAAGGDQRNRSLLKFNSSGAVWYVNVYTQTDTRQQQLTPTASAGSTVTVASTSGLEVGMVVTWAGGSATITSILSSTQFVLSQALPGLPQLTATVQSDTAAPIVTTVTVGDRIAPPAGHELAGYIDNTNGASTGYYPAGYLNPFTVGVAAANLGAIIPVNAHPLDNIITVRWFKKISPPAGSSGFHALYVPGKVGRYTVSYPAPLASNAAAHITIAEGVGSGDLVEPQLSGSIYTQNDPNEHGYNPNEEHALMIGGRAYALREDLNHYPGLPPPFSYSQNAYTSHPFVLLAYTAADKRPAMRVFKVRRIYDQDGDGNKDPGDILFNYTATAGTLLVKPYPLPLLPLPLVGTGATAVSKDVEIAGANPPTNNDFITDEAYKSFTFKDRKGFTWIHRGPHDTGTPTLTMKLYYKSQGDFFIPGIGVPAAGTILPFLRAADRSGQPLTLAEIDVDEDDQPLPIIYTPAWPANPPELRVGETLTLPKFGLPQVRGQTSAQVLYQQSLAKAASGQTKNAVTLHDPTRAKTVALGKNTSLAKLPTAIKTSSYQGRTYFQGLPAHLQQRFFFDPVRDTKGSLVLIGQFHDEIAGEDYLDLNLLTTAELAAVKALLPSGDDKSKWDAAIDALNTKVETFARSSAQSSSWTVASTANIGESDLAEISSPNTAVDSYALTATGQGDGFVTLVFGNGGNPGQQPEGDPVQVKVIKVTNQLYVGDLKVVKSSNPLDEQVTLRHSGDYAGKPENYEFEWRWATGAASAPKTYTTVMTKRLGVAGSNQWIVMSDPGAVTPEAYVGSPVPFPRSVNVRQVNYLLDAQNQPIALPATVLTLENTGGLSVGKTVTGPGITGQASIINVIDSKRLVISQVIEEGLDGEYVFETGTKNARSSALASNIIDATSYTDADLAAGYPSLIAYNTAGVNFASGVPGTIVLSAKIGDFDGFVLYVNDQPALAYNAPTPQFTNTAAGADLTTTHGLVNPKQFSLAPSYFKPGTNTIQVAIYTTADPNAFSTLDFLIEAAQETPVVTELNGWFAPDPGNTNTALVGGNPSNPFGGSPFVLNDRWFTMRYRANPFLADGTTPNPAYALTNGGTWSRWMPPQFVEGWIKRVLAAINPFEQRVKDLYNNSVNTDVSVLTQAGTRWEGDIALNMENINDAGLIAIYETVLNRAKSMSIDAGANDPDTNNALILAAGYLNDLYTIVGNEAYADAANPTISLDDQDTVTEVNTSRFSFEGQVSSSLEEELAMLKGRDDSVSPGVTTAPFYNRLVWNYTQGINSGQVLYAVNYNIKEKVGSSTADGVIDESDAQRMFPQGHGDAYGHYLTALTGYYRLVSHPNFNWQTRAEAVSVLGQPVTVDFQDERKFAAAAGNLARTAQQICALTYRKNYKDDPAAGWEHFRDTAKGQNLDEWVSRSTQGALYHWAVGNALVPDVDPYHTGVQKIDRSTIPELPELATAATSFQVTIDNANARLNPLGLSPGAIAFDIDPTFLAVGSTAQIGTRPVQGQGLFGQLYQRALASLVNAGGAFNQAGKMTRSLRYQQNQIDDYTTSIEQQEVAYVNELIDIFGRPYSGDVGPGKLYSQDYNGPDLLHWFIVDRPNDLVDTLQEITLVRTELRQVNFFTGNALQDIPIGFAGQPTAPSIVTVTPSQFVQYNDVWQAGGLGTRPETGDLQDALQDAQQSLLAIHQAKLAFENQNQQVQGLKALVSATISNHAEQLKALSTSHTEVLRLERLVRDLEISASAFDDLADISDGIADATSEAFPTVVGLSYDATSPLRGAIEIIGQVARGIFKATALATRATGRFQETNIVEEEQDLTSTLTSLGFKAEELQLAYEYDNLLRETYTQGAELMQLTIAHQRALQNVSNVLSSANRILAQREVFRQRAAAIIQGYRTKDLTFRLFRNEALEQYRSLFDLASRYTYLAAKAYDYETGLLGTPAGRTVFNDIVAARSLGDVTAGTPLVTVSNLGDHGLAGVMARLNADFSVAEGRLGINNPDQYGTVFSLRHELFRIPPHAEDLPSDTPEKIAVKRASDDAWKQRMEQHIRPNVLNDADVATYCRNIRKANGSAVPGFIIPFTTTIEQGKNFFNLLLAGGDHSYSPASFATKIHSVGIALPGYIGMDAYASGNAGSGAPASNDPNALSATPYVYLIPCGTDIMRAPPLGDTGVLRFWDVKDQALPLPYNLGAVDFNNTQFFNADGTLTEQPWIIRKHQPFRAVSDPAFFYSSVPQEFTNTRLIARSVWNTQWKIVIPAYTLLNNEQSGLDKFTATVEDIQLFLRTYSHSGN